MENNIGEKHLKFKSLHDSQHAYRAGRSTETALYQLTELTQANLDSKETAISAFLDFPGAFDNIVPNKVMKRSVETREANRMIIRWFLEMLSTQQITFFKIGEAKRGDHIGEKHLKFKPLHDSQHAYRAGRSTVTALYQLTELTQANLDSKETAISAFLDFSGAFDNIPNEVIKRSVETREVNRTIIRWFSETLSTQQITFFKIGKAIYGFMGLTSTRVLR